jgi:hypothetical protein
MNTWTHAIGVAIRINREMGFKAYRVALVGKLHRGWPKGTEYFYELVPSPALDASLSS